jgi:hypothetical protein
MVAWKMPTFFNVRRLTVVHSYSKKMLESGDIHIKGVNMRTVATYVVISSPPHPQYKRKSGYPKFKLIVRLVRFIRGIKLPS